MKRLGTTLAIGVVLLSSANAHADAFSGRRIALVVGVNQFEDDHWTDLVFARDDARDVGAVLKRSFDRVVVVGDSKPATKSAVVDALASLSTSNVSDLDTVVIYLSTHGTLAYDDRGALRRVLVLSDTTAADPIGTGLVHEELVDRLRGLRARHKVLILAACHSGAGKSVLTDEIRHQLRGLKSPFFAEPRLTIGEGQLILAASAWGESAREDDALRHDIYTHFLLEALRGFDSNGDGATTALEAHDYARTRTLEYTNGRQRPTLTAEIVGEAPIVLAGRILRAGDPVVAAYAERFGGAVLELDGRPKGPLPGSYAMSAGHHHIRVMRPGASVPMLDTTVNLEPGTVLLLDREVESSNPTVRVDASLAWAFVRNQEIERSYLSSHPVLTIEAAYLFAERWRAGLATGLVYSNTSIAAGASDGTQRVALGRAAGTVAYEAWALAGFSLDAALQLGWTVGQRRARANGTSVGQLVAFPFARGALTVTYLFSDTFGLRVGLGLELAAMRVEDRTRAVFMDDYGVSAVARW